MEHGTTLLFGLSGVTVKRVELLADGVSRRVRLMGQLSNPRVRETVARAGQVS